MFWFLVLVLYGIESDSVSCGRMWGRCLLLLKYVRVKVEGMSRHYILQSNCEICRKGVSGVTWRSRHRSVTAKVDLSRAENALTQRLLMLQNERI